MTIYSENKDDNGYLYNLFIKKNISGGFEVTYAKKGIFENTTSVPVLVLFDGETITSKNDGITNISFSQSDFGLSNLKANTITHQKNQEMPTFEIISCILILNKIGLNYFSKNQNELTNCREGNNTNLIKEFYKRLIVPLYIPILMLVPYILIFSSKEKSNYNKMKLFTFIVGVIVIIFSESLIRFITIDIQKNLFIFFIPLISLISFYLLFFYKFKIKSFSK